MNALITDEQRALLLANGRESSQNPDFDPAPVVKLPIERDLYFRAEKLLSAYARDARLAGRIIV